MTSVTIGLVHMFDHFPLFIKSRAQSFSPEMLSCAQGTGSTVAYTLLVLLEWEHLPVT